MAVTKRSIASAILGAKRILQTDGWTVGHFRCAEGRHCAVGALRAQILGVAEPQNNEREQSRQYIEAIRALAVAVAGPKTVDKRLAEVEKDAVTYGLTPQVALEESIDTLENIVIDFNDGRTTTTNGRNAVLRRFDKAAELVSA